MVSATADPIQVMRRRMFDIRDHLGGIARGQPIRLEADLAGGGYIFSDLSSNPP